MSSRSSMPISNCDNYMVISRGYNFKIAQCVDGPGFLIHNDVGLRAALNRVLHVGWRDTTGFLMEHMAATFAIRNGNICDRSSAAW